MSPTKKRLLNIIFIYLLVGFIYGMMGEFRLKMKYSLIITGSINYFTVFKDTMTDPYGYLRAAIDSIVWPVDLYYTIYHFHNPFGYPIPK